MWGKSQWTGLYVFMVAQENYVHDSSEMRSRSALIFNFIRTQKTTSPPVPCEAILNLYETKICKMSLTNAQPEDAARAARSASRVLSSLSTAARNDALSAIHDALKESKDEILAANAKDLELAKKAAEDGQLSLSLLSRLDLGKKGKWDDMLKGILDVRELEDPGRIYLSFVPNQHTKMLLTHGQLEK